MQERKRRGQRIGLVLAAFALGCVVPLAVWALGRTPRPATLDQARAAEAAALVDRLAALGYEVEAGDDSADVVGAGQGAEPGSGSVATSASEDTARPVGVDGVSRAEPAPVQRPAYEPAPAQEPAYEPVPVEEPVYEPASVEDSAGADRYPETAEQPVAAAPETVYAVVPRGRVLAVELSEPLSSRTAQPGDRFAMQLSEPLYLPEGAVVPAGSSLVGRVREVEHAKRPQKPGRLVLGAESLEIDGRRYALEATLDADGEQLRGRGSHEEDAGRIGIGAAAGTVLGAILGGKKGALAGLVLGGGGVFLATRGEDVELPAGMALTARLDQDLEMELPAR